MSDVEPRENPYRVAKAAAKGGRDETPHRSLFVLMIAGFEAFIGVIAGSLAPLVIGNFEELFKGFGAELPALTRFILATRHAWVLFSIAAIAIVVWIVRRPASNQKEHRRQKMAVIVYAMLFAMAAGIAVIALYLPIFQLGAVV